MCFFPLPNTNRDSLAYKKGVYSFDCGACPECLRKRANVWALRAVYEAREHAFNCMVTLTYDNYAYDEDGKIIGELPPDRNLHVDKRDVQLFVKRLRKWYSSITNEKIKFFVGAEYGSKTHRAHYHLILFGVRFPDLVYYKKSKRGNPIYKSHKLTTLWKHGICTVDSININSAIARYCTKYCAKQRSEDTFQLFSHHIGEKGLLRDFNGISYFVDGREFTIPRQIWAIYISNKYGVSSKYVNRSVKTLLDNSFYDSKEERSVFRWFRDSDSLYCRYLAYWRARSVSFEQCKTSVEQRIYLLDDSKFHNYKIQAFRCLTLRRNASDSCIAPGSGCIAAVARYYFLKFGFELFFDSDRCSDSQFVERDLPIETGELFRVETCPIPSRLNRASDTIPPVYSSVYEAFQAHLLRDRLKISNRLKKELRNRPKPRVFMQFSLDNTPFF